MCHDIILDDKLFNLLAAEDTRIAAGVKANGCGECGGRLDRADYPRKPRGGDAGTAGEKLDRRCSFCCCRQGCRRRATPPSLVFLGRRVYLGIVVLVATLRGGGAAAAAPSPPERTVRRWRAWFATLRESTWLAAIRGRLWPPPEPTDALPAVLVDRLGRDRSIGDALVATLRLLSPLTTRSVPR